MKPQSLLLTLWIAPCLLSQAEDTERINILHIDADDHRPDGLHAFGTKALQTPNLDPLELVNQAAREEYSDKLSEMTALLEGGMARYADEQPLVVKHAKWTPPTPSNEQ